MAKLVQARKKREEYKAELEQLRAADTAANGEALLLSYAVGEEPAKPKRRKNGASVAPLS